MKKTFSYLILALIFTPFIAFLVFNTFGGMIENSKGEKLGAIELTKQTKKLIETSNETSEKDEYLNQQESLETLELLNEVFPQLRKLEYVVIKPDEYDGWPDNALSYLYESPEGKWTLYLATAQTSVELQKNTIDGFCTYVWQQLPEQLRGQWKVRTDHLSEFKVWCNGDLTEETKLTEGKFSFSNHPFNNDLKTAYNGYLDHPLYQPLEDERGGGTF